MAVGKPATPVQDRVWSSLLAMSEPVAVGQLLARTDPAYLSAIQCLGRWVGAGLVARTGGVNHGRYRLNDNTERTAMPPIVSASGHARKRLPAGYQRLWSAIRVLKRFDLPLLRMTAGTGEQATRGYLGHLQRTGYVVQTATGSNQRGTIGAFKLVRDPGPKAPRETTRVIGGVQRRLLVDPNTGAEHDIGRGTPSLRKRYRRSPAIVDGGVG